MSLDKINELVNSIAKLVESSEKNNEKVAIPVLSVKLHRLAEAHPYDQSIVSMASIVSKMADHDKLFITRTELKDLYNKLYSRNTKLAEYLEAELGSAPEIKKEAFEQTQAPLTNSHKPFVDPVLANALAAAWDGAVPLKSFTQDAATLAKRAVASNLDVWNLRASTLDVEAGNEYFIVIKADYNTPKGTTSVFVPVETRKGKVLEPSVFMCNAGPQELNNTNLKNYITKFAGAKLRVRAGDVLKVLTKEVTGTDIISDLEMAVTKVASAKEQGHKEAGFIGGITGQSIYSEPKKDVNLPHSKETETFAAKFASASGIADFTHGSDKLNLGRDVIVRQLAGFGIKNPQIRVISSDDTTIFYGVSLFGGKTAFKVPVKIANDRIVSPDVLICDGSVASFSKESISDLLVASATDSKVAAATSSQHALTPAELVQNVRMAVAEGNYSKAEDALNILQQSGNATAYRDAFASYINGMGAIKKEASEKTTCSRIVKNATSSHPLCGHTNLPLHKVYQDEHGNCQPLYRKGMKETSEGAFFMNAKIFG